MTWLLPRTHPCFPSAREWEGSTWALGSSGEGPAFWVASSGTPSPQGSSWIGWRARTWSRALFGRVISTSSTLPPSVVEWISSQPVTRASPSQPPGPVSVRTILAICGLPSSALLARWRPRASCWRTYGDTSPSGSTEFSGTWPKTGSMRSGRLFEHPTPERRTVESGSSSWPTPDASLMNDGEDPDSFERRRKRLAEKGYNGNGASTPLAMAVKAIDVWPTPRTLTGGAESAERKKELGRTDSGGGDLQAAAQSFPLGGPSRPQATGEALPAGATLRLNPTFVEWLMGLPPFWTLPSGSEPIVSAPSETPSSPIKQPSLFES